VEPEEATVARQRLDIHVPDNEYARSNRETDGSGAFYAVRAEDISTAIRKI
jgi:hypothetical protein